ncbi:MAG: hypothetical protein AB2792_19685 [Candidatus Thiodiazotropha sp.]
MPRPSRNEMAVRSMATAERVYQVTSTGFVAHGSIVLDGRELDSEEQSMLNIMSRAAVHCNEASLEQRDGLWRMHGDPMEGALLIAGTGAGLDVDITKKQYPRNDLIPFESERRLMATPHHNRSGNAFIIIKGVPEQLLTA